jgi:multidrug resistance protein, MATE family
MDARSAEDGLSARVETTDKRGLGAELRELFVLGGPIALSFVGTQLLGFVDIAMVGRLDATSLAAVGIGNAIFFTLSIVGMGLVLGMDPLVSQAHGAGEPDRARAVLWQAVRLALFASVPCMVLVVLGGAFTHRFGIDPAIARLVFHFILGRLPNLVTFLLFAAGRVYLQALGRTRAVVWAAVWSNVANLVFNTIFIFGDDGLARVGLPRVGLPALGVLGSGMASSLASIAAVVVVFRDIVRRGGWPTAAERRADPATMRSITRIGWPIAMHLLAEVGAFSVAGIFAGWLGPGPAAGHQVALGLASMSFVTALGLSNATSVRVGRAIGRGDPAGARRAGIVGICTAMVVMAIAAVVFAIAPWACARILTDEPDILAAAVPLIRIAAVFQLADAAQVAVAGALRGAGDTRSAQIANMLGYYLLGLPLALVLGFVFDLGAVGIWWGLTAALFAVAFALVIRFLRMSSDEMRRI